MAMTNEELQTKIAVHDEKFDAFLREMKDFKDELKDFKNEMRDRDNRRAAENEEIRNNIKEIYTTTDAKISTITNKIDEMSKHVQNISIAAFAGIGTLAVTSIIGIAAMVWSVLHK